MLLEKNYTCICFDLKYLLLIQSNARGFYKMEREDTTIEEE